MTWVRIDDGAVLHPKLLDAGPDGVCLWLAGLSHCNRNHTDGVILRRHLASLYPWQTPYQRLTCIADKLVAVRLWELSEDGWTVHDYEQYQGEATREEVEIRRAYERERKQKQRQSRRKAIGRPGNVPDNVRDNVPDMSRGHAPGTSASHVPPLSRGPVPARPVPKSTEGRDGASSPPTGGAPAAPSPGVGASGRPRNGVPMTPEQKARYCHLRKTDPGAVQAYLASLQAKEPEQVHD